MTTKECYEKIGADYENAIENLASDERVRKYALRFIDDRSFWGLKEAMESEDYDSAFKHSHNLKGICQNISLSNMFESTGNLTGALRERSRDTELAKKYFRDVEAAYMETVDVLSRLKETQI